MAASADGGGVPKPVMRRRRHRAGESVLREWRAQRWRTLRRDWRDWGKLLIFIPALIAGVVVAHGVAQLISAGLLGSMLTLAVFGWVLGGDAHSLPWLWGRVGEQQTEDALEQLGEGWYVEHDIPCDRGNWDHVVVGPGGVFLLETKSYRAAAVVANDVLYLGRQPFKGGGFRSAAKGVHDSLQQALARPPWVQPVVVIWGAFPQCRHEENGVVYLGGSELMEWLEEQQVVSDPARNSEIIAAVKQLRTPRTLHQLAPAQS